MRTSLPRGVCVFGGLEHSSQRTSPRRAGLRRTAGDCGSYRDPGHGGASRRDDLGVGHGPYATGTLRSRSVACASPGTVCSVASGGRWERRGPGAGSTCSSRREPGFAQGDDPVADRRHQVERAVGGIPETVVGEVGGARTRSRRPGAAVGGHPGAGRSESVEVPPTTASPDAVVAFHADAVGKAWGTLRPYPRATTVVAAEQRRRPTVPVEVVADRKRSVGRHGMQVERRVVTSGIGVPELVGSVVDQPISTDSASSSRSRRTRGANHRR